MCCQDYLQKVHNQILVLDIERLTRALVSGNTVRRYQVVLELSQSLLEHPVYVGVVRGTGTYLVDLATGEN